jgi:hypothetical protein
MGFISLIMLMIFSKIGLERAFVACESFAAKPLLRVDFGGKRFHPSQSRAFVTCESFAAKQTLVES